MSSNKLLLLIFAYDFAARKHSSQRRKGAGDIPYINHPIEVVKLLSETLEYIDYELLIAALLHDTVEDTDTTVEELIQLFGKEITSIVMEVTDDMSLPKHARRKLQIEHAATLSEKAKMIKIADKACNIIDIISTRLEWSVEKKIDYILWANEVVNRCSGVNAQLEKEYEDALKKARHILGNF